MNNNSINTKNIDLNEEEDLPLPPPPPPECLIDYKYTSQKTPTANIETINQLDNVNKLARTLSLNKNYENPSSFIKNSSFLPMNNNKASQQTPLKRSNTLNSSNSSSPLNNKLNALTTRLNRLSVVNRTSSFRRGDIHHLFQDAVVDDLEETDDLDEESIELNTTSSPSSDSSSSSKEISSSSSSSSASSVIYSTNNSEDLNKLNESSSTTSNSNSDYQSNQIIMDQNNTFKSTRINSNNNKNQNEKLISQILRNKTNDSNSIYGVGTFKPAPPSRSSSLQYRVNPMNNNSNQKSKFYQLLTNNQNNNNLENVYNNLLMNNENNNTSFDRSSIYSTFSLRASNLTRLSSFNLQNNYKNNNDSNNNSNKNENIYGTRLETLDLLNKSEIFKIESCYKSMCSIVNSAKCMAELHTTNLENLVKLLDWKLQLSGVPVWVFNTGLNPKRKKELTLVLADKKTGFALWKLNNMNYKNDFKWTKPGHLTFKIFASNIANPELFGLIKPSISCESSSMLINDNMNGAKLKRRFSLKKSNSLSYQQQQSLNIKSSNTMSNLNDKNEYIFGAIKFDNDFECSKFYDYYRTLLVDRKNDDLFNPNFNFVNKSATISGSNSLSFMKSKEKSSSNNIVKILYKKITKNSISSPCAFTHVNGLTVLSEDAYLNTPSNINLNINMDSQSLIMNDSLSILTPQSSIFSKNST